MDRNLGDRAVYQVNQVALRKESVDRNQYLSGVLDFAPVALRKESVDRNRISRLPRSGTARVALRKESVDRNHDGMLKYRDAERRSPQGERG